MADYQIKLGVDVQTKDIDTKIKNYKAQPVDVTLKPNTQKIDDKIRNYKAPKQIDVTLKPNTQKVDDKIRNYKAPKQIDVTLKPNVEKIDDVIKSYQSGVPIKVNVELNRSSINEQIRQYNQDKAGQFITLDAKLNDGAIDDAIKNFQAGKKIPIDIDPNFEAAESMLKGYEARNPINVRVKLLKGSINEDVAQWNRETNLTTVILDAKIKGGALSGAIAEYQAKHPNQCKIPIDLTLGSTDELDQKLNAYKTLKEGTYIPVRLTYAKDFDRSIVSKPIKIPAIPDFQDIETVIGSYVPMSELKVNVKLMPKDINKQVKDLKTHVTELVEVGVKPDKTTTNKAITDFKPTAQLGVGVKLLTDDINSQIEDIHPTSAIKVDVKLNNDVIDEKAGKQKKDAAIQNIDQQISGFTTKTPVNVGVKLNFTGVWKQIKEYKTESKVNVGIKLKDGEGVNSVKSQIKTLTPNEPIELGVKLDLEPAKAQIEELRKQFEQFGKITINFGGTESGSGAADNDNVGGGKNVSPAAQKFKEVDIEVTNASNSVKNLQKALSNVGFNKGSIDTITKEFNELGISVKNVTSRLHDDGSVTLTVKGIDQFERAVKVMRSVDEKGNITNLGTTISQDFKETENAFKRLKTLGKEISQLDIKLAGLDADKSKQEIAELINQLNRLEAEYNDLFDITENNLSASQVDELAQGIANSSNRIDAVKARVADKAVVQRAKQEAAEIKNVYDDIVKTKEKINGLEIDLIGAEANDDLEKAKAINDEIERLKNNLRALEANGYAPFAEDGIYGSKFSDEQNAALIELDERLNARKNIASAGAVDKSNKQKVKQEAAEINDAYTSIYNAKKRIGDLEVELIGAKANSDLDRVKAINDEITRLKNNLDALDKDDAFSSKFSDKQNAALAELEKQNEYRQMYAKSKIVDAKEDLVKDIKFKLDTKDFEKDISNIETKMRGLGNASKDLKKDITQLKSNRTQMENALKTGDIEKVIKAYERYYKLRDKIDNELKISGNKQKDIDADFSKLEKLKKEINDINKKVVNLDPKVNMNQLDGLSARLNELQTEYDGLYKKIKGNLSDSQKAKLDIDTEKAEADLDELRRKLDDTKAKLANAIKIKLVNSDSGLSQFDNEVGAVTSKFSQLKNKTPELQAAMNNLSAAFKKVKDAAKNGTPDELIQANKEYEAVLKSVNAQLDIYTRKKRDADASQKLEDDIKSFQSNIDAWLTKNSAAAKQFGAKLQELKVQAENCDRATLDHLQAEFKSIDKQAEATGLKIQTLGDRIKTQFQKYSSYFSVASVFMYLGQGLRSAFEQVKLIDSAMTELKKVTNETDESYNQFLKNAASRATELGTTIDGLVGSTADFARLGYDFKDAQGLAEVANIYAVVGDEIEGVEDATQSLVSTLAAFKHEMNGMSDADFAMSIVDKMNEVANNYSISSGGIGEALQRSASSMAAANNSLDETIAMITAANEVAQNPEKVGNAMKTMSMRIRGAKTE